MTTKKTDEKGNTRYELIYVEEPKKKLKEGTKVIENIVAIILLSTSLIFSIVLISKVL